MIAMMKRMVGRAGGYVVDVNIYTRDFLSGVFGWVSKALSYLDRGSFLCACIANLFESVSCFGFVSIHLFDEHGGLLSFFFCFRSSLRALKIPYPRSILDAYACFLMQFQCLAVALIMDHIYHVQSSN